MGVPLSFFLFKPHKYTICVGWHTYKFFFQKFSNRNKQYLYNKKKKKNRCLPPYGPKNQIIYKNLQILTHIHIYVIKQERKT